MGEFVFRNLSVKVFPVARDEAICSDESVTVMECTPCTGTFTPCDDLGAVAELDNCRGRT